MNFEDVIEMAESLKFEDSNYSFRMSEKSGSPLRRNRYTCYSCGGKPPNSQHCSVCKGIKTVSDENPLSQLLADILSKKLLHNNISNELPEIREAIHTHCSEIQEQSDLADDRTVICDVCQQLCSCYTNCQQCKHYYVCVQCFDRNKFKHEHKLLRPTTSQEEIAETKKCIHCKDIIEDLYLSCQTCLRNGQVYELCSACSQKSRQFHDPMHKFQTRLHRQAVQHPSAVDDWMNSIDGCRNSYFFDDDNERQEQEQVKEEVKEEAKVKEKNTKIEPSNNWLIPQANKSKSSSPDKVIPSRIKIIVNDDSDEDLSSYREKDSTHKSEQTSSEGFVFEDYQCDQCSQNPRKYRYHCRHCQDFDLCSHCYELRAQLHDHEDFEQISEAMQKDLEVEEQKRKEEKFNTMVTKFSINEKCKIKLRMSLNQDKH